MTGQIQPIYKVDEMEQELDELKQIRKDIIKLEREMDNKLLQIYYKINKYIKDNTLVKQ